ncbi:MAG: ATP-binding protein, partial [Bacteroidetes bacterium]|nr:ATP-binding protein [Bacteroidota bacterium]
LQHGGLPELFHLLSEETKTHYTRSLKDTILYKDIVQRYKIKDAVLLEDIFRFLCDNIGNLTSIMNIVNYLKNKRTTTNYETVSNYISYLKQTYLIHEVERYDIKGKELLSGTRKYYLNDLAFRKYMIPSFGFGLSGNLENAVYLHFKSLGYNVYAGAMRNREIDFVIEKNNEKKYIQVCYSLSDEDVIKREFGNLSFIHDNYEKMVITLDEVSFGEKDGIRHTCAWEL